MWSARGIFTDQRLFGQGNFPIHCSLSGYGFLGGLVYPFMGALTYAELAGMFPKAGGDYLFLKAAMDRGAGFLLGWINFWIIIPGCRLPLFLWRQSVI
jgi:APA family basic amino acid/polyamine antiporter